MVWYFIPVNRLIEIVGCQCVIYLVDEFYFGAFAI